MHLEMSTTFFTPFPYKELLVLHKIYAHIHSLKVSLIMLPVTQAIQCKLIED